VLFLIDETSAQISFCGRPVNLTERVTVSLFLVVGGRSGCALLFDFTLVEDLVDECVSLFYGELLGNLDLPVVFVRHLLDRVLVWRGHKRGKLRDRRHKSLTLLLRDHFSLGVDQVTLLLTRVVEIEAER
jgi:hypothetical protein